MQPNAIEFDLALEWRQLLGQLAAAKLALCLGQARELAAQLAAYAEVRGGASGCLGRLRGEPSAAAGRAPG